MRAWQRSIPVLAVFSLSCSTLSSFTTPGGLVNTAGDVARNQAKCAPILSNEIPQDEEIAVGGAISVNWLKLGQGVFAAGNPDNEVNAYLNRVGKNLAAHSTRPNLPWTFGAVEATQVNAYSAPGGYVLVSKGLLRRVKTEAELAGVLAHEIAHVNRKHALEQYRQAKYGSCTAGGLGASVLSREGGTAGGILASTDLFQKVIDQAVDGIVKVGYAKEAEFDADREALSLILQAGYDPKPFLGFLAGLEGGGGFFDNHPPSADRAARLQAQLDNLKNDQPFLASMDAPKTVPLKNELSAVK